MIGSTRPCCPDRGRVVSVPLIRCEPAEARSDRQPLETVTLTSCLRPAPTRMDEVLHSTRADLRLAPGRFVGEVLIEKRPTQASGRWQKIGTATEPFWLTVSRVWTRVILPVDGVVKVMSRPNTVVVGANCVAAAVSLTR